MCSHPSFAGAAMDDPYFVGVKPRSHPDWTSFFSSYECLWEATPDGQIQFNCLGAGACGAVFECRSLVTSELLALKIIDVPSSPTGSPAHVDKVVEREALLLMSLKKDIEQDIFEDNPPEQVTGARYLVRVFDYFVRYDESRGAGAATVYVVMERCPLAEAFQVKCHPATVISSPDDDARLLPNGTYSSYAASKTRGTGKVDLFDYIGELTDIQCRYVIRQLLALLAYLHQLREDRSRILHRDIKIENTLVWAWHEENGNRFPIIKVIDFGLARVVISEDIDTITKGIGTARCMAPELYTPTGLGYIYDEKVDIFAVGCTYFMMLTSYEPVAVPRDTKPLAWPERFGLERPRCSKFVEPTGELTRDGLLLSHMTQSDPFHRPSARELFDWCNTWM